MRIVKQTSERFSRRQAEAIGAALRATDYAKYTTEAAIAKQFQTSQSRVSRLFNGQFVRRTDLVERLCKAAGIEINAHISRQVTEDLPIPLKMALDHLWDGSHEGAKSIANLLEAASRCVGVKP